MQSAHKKNYPEQSQHENFSLRIFGPALQNLK